MSRQFCVLCGRWTRLHGFAADAAYTSSKETAHRCGSILQRQFIQTFPKRCRTTDVTYIPTKHGMAYMCAVIGLCGKTVLSFRLGTDMTSTLVIDAIPRH